MEFITIGTVSESTTDFGVAETGQSRGSKWKWSRNISSWSSKQ